jgi:asparagine synthase (glutamine-hydrolysing)
MCGIAGVLAVDGRRDVTPLVERLTAAQSHRGPDGSGFRFFRGRSAAFGHRRLSIVDLECGAQPMSNEDGNVWLVFNGELYNHLDLRRELEGLGHRFRTQSDVEPVIHGWEAWGRGLLERMNGMYAFALFDGRTGQGGHVWLARDPAGVKPLYVGAADGMWWFASELAAAGRCGLLEDSLRPQAFGEYLVYRFVPSPGTFYRRAWKVPPGHCCRLALDEPPVEPKFARFTARFQPTSTPKSQSEWAEALREGLRAAVRRQMMSDVPVGVLLSGGVDSTVVTQLMRDASRGDEQAFAVGFSDTLDVRELPAARRSAGTLGIPLAELSVTRQRFLDAWPVQISALGEPIANTGILLIGLLCEVVRRTRKVALTGQGADEPLGGYPRHAAERWFPIARHLGWLLRSFPDRLVTGDRLSRMRRAAAESDEVRRFTEILAVFSPSEAVRLVREASDSAALDEPVRSLLRLFDSGDSLNRLLQVDARLSLADDLLLVADHTSMASSVELRVPFLDLEFLALVERMPSRYKVSSLGERKWLYRRAVRELIPSNLRHSLLGWKSRTGRKLGFSTPLDDWFRTWLRSDAKEYLLGKQARVPAFLNADGVESLLVNARDGVLRGTRQLLSLYVLETWLRARLGGPGALAVRP